MEQKLFSKYFSEFLMMSSDGNLWKVYWNIIIRLGVIYSVYDTWKKIVRENLAKVIFTTEVDDAYFNDSKFAEKLFGI